MLARFLNWKTVGVLVLVGVVVAGYYKLQYDAEKAKVEQQQQEISGLEVDKQRLQSELLQFERDMVAQINKNNRLEEQIAQLNEEKRSIIRELEEAKGRQELVWRYPLTVQRFFRSNWRDRTDAMSCAMGVLEKCSDSSQQE